MISNEQKETRKKYIGGSDIPEILGIGYKKPIELLLEKAGYKEREVDNIYTDIGNEVEKIVQEHLKLKNVDDEEFIKDNFIGHLDGLEEDTVIEIKCTSDPKNMFKKAELQANLYMYLTNTKKAKIIIVDKNKEPKIKEMEEEFINKNKLKFNQTLTEEQKEELINEIAKIKNEIIAAITVQEIKIDDKVIELIKNTSEIFLSVLNEMKEDILFNPESEAEVKEYEKKLNDLINEKNDVSIYEDKILAFETQIKEFKALEKEYKEQKEKILEIMESQKIKKIDNEKFSITYTAPTTKKDFDKKTLEKEQPEIYKKYEKISNVKSKLTITLKKEKKNDKKKI